MRWLIVLLLVVWSVLTVVGYTVVLPDTRRDDEVVRAYFALADNPPNEHVRAVVGAFLADPEVAAADRPGPGPGGFADVLLLPEREQQRYLRAFAAFYNRTQDRALSETPTLVWSTDDNPARRIQCRLFRAWHLREYGEPIDIVTDPANRDITKIIVQCVAGAGPDLIESYGPIQLQQLVSAGVALDVTEAALAGGFDPSRVFPAAVSSMVMDGRQYGFPCNVGYVVLFYHRDLFRQAGVPEPTGPWTLAEMIEAGKKLMATDASGRRTAIMGMHPTPMAQAAGATLFNETGTLSIYNSPQTVAAFRAYQDLMYVHRVMPTPAEAASMAAGGGANMNADAASASASALFAAKVSAMVTDGRWSYKGLAERNRDRVIVPAIDRRLAGIDGAGEEAGLLRSARATLLADVLMPLSEAEEAAYRATLTDADRALLLDLGVAHIPTISGTPYYEAGARVAIVNRAGEKTEHATRFLRFLASGEYNEQINQTFDSICGVPEFCLDENGISGPPRALPGMEGFDSPVFVEAMFEYAHPTELSPFVGRGRIGMLDGPIIERLTLRQITPEEAARQIEDRVNEQIHANLVRDAELRGLWERLTGKTFDPSKTMREQFPEVRSTTETRRHGEGSVWESKSGNGVVGQNKPARTKVCVCFTHYELFSVSPCLRGWPSERRAA